MMSLLSVLFFFSSRRRHTRSYGDWSSDVCSSDLSRLTFAHWLMDTYANPKMPLATVDLLLSTADQTYDDEGTAVVPIDPATFENVRNAIIAWYNRGTSKDDMMMFFWSGHGIAPGGVQLLLCEDYGKDPKAKFAHAINF